MSEQKSHRDPAWLLDLDEKCKPYLAKLVKVTPISEASDDKMRQGLLQAGVAIVEPFRHWLTRMKERTEPGKPAHTFLTENQEEETLHWMWWLDMAEPYGLRKEDFDKVTLSRPMRELNEYMWECSRSAPLPVAIAAVNYCIETAAAQMTAAFTNAYADRLGDKAGRWVQAHKEGDVEHSKTARELLVDLTAGDPALQEQATHAALRAYELFYAAMSNAIPADAVA